MQFDLSLTLFGSLSIYESELSINVSSYHYIMVDTLILIK